MRISTEELKKRRDQMQDMLKYCTLCPHKCRIDRVQGQQGVCRSGVEAKVYNFMAHHGEEPVLSGEYGSGTIFFSNCHMKCVYCQNYQFSQLGQGKEVVTKRLAQMMLDLQAMKCHNINLVSPTHFLPQILDALLLLSTTSNGLIIPIVYNSGGYENIEILKLLDGIVDIYMPDMRYADDKIAKKYSHVDNYVEINRSTVLEMHRQVGTKGLIIRHLVLPNNLAGTEEIMKFIAEKISKDVPISLMSQYYPTYKASDYPLINRRLNSKEYQKAVDIVISSGFSNGWFQPDITEDITQKFIGTNFKSNV
jgi:putative pyruvate formate lyase activating enzyme